MSLNRVLCLQTNTFLQVKGLLFFLSISAACLDDVRQEFVLSYVHVTQSGFFIFFVTIILFDNANKLKYLFHEVFGETLCIYFLFVFF